MSIKEQPPFYFIPGWGFHSSVFKCPAFSPFSNAIHLDYCNVKNPSLEAVSAYLSTRIRDQSTVIAWSLGGLFALHIAHCFPQKIKKLVLIASQPRFLADHDWQGISEQTAHHFITQSKNNRAALLAYFLKLVNYPCRSPEQKNYLSQHLMESDTTTLTGLLNLMFNTDLRKEYKSIQPNILHIINGKDAVLKQNKHQLQRLNQEIQCMLANSSGHAGFLTHHEHYTQTIKDFLHHDSVH